MSIADEIAAIIHEMRLGRSSDDIATAIINHLEAAHPGDAGEEDGAWRKAGLDIQFVIAELDAMVCARDDTHPISPDPEACVARLEAVEDYLIRRAPDDPEGLGWKPIETRPTGRNDCPYLAWGPDAGFFVVERPWGVNTPDEPEATVWRPLPPAPSPQEPER